LISPSFPPNCFYIAAAFYLAAAIFHLLSMEKSALCFLGGGLLINMLSEIAARLFIWPYCNMFAEPFFLPLCLSIISLILIVLSKAKDGLSLLPLIALLSLIAIFFSEGYYPPFTILSKSIHSHLFHLFAFISHCCLIAGAYLAVWSLAGKISDDIAYQIIIWGFAFLSLGGLFGMLWSYMGRSDFVSWNHYYFHSIAIWLYYAGFLHLHLLKGWDQNKKTWMLAGGAIMIFYLDYLPQIGRMHIPGVLDGGLYELY